MTSLINIEEYKETFEKASFDDANGVSMITDGRKEVYILDEIAKKIEAIFEMDRPSSCDSVVVKGDNIYLIEFKNRDYKKIKSVDKREIRKKAYQSREILLGTFFADKTPKYIAEHVKLLVVFKSIENESKSFDKISGAFNRLANGEKPEIKCKLGSFEGTFYREVYTISKEDFETNYMPLISGAM